MFDTPDPKTLRATLDCIPVAMFAAERPGPDEAFRMLCINRQYEDETKLANVEVEGLRPMEMLSPRQGEAAESRYAFCCRNEKVISYTETLHLNGMETRWHTVLYPLNLSDRRQRVIGSAFALSPDGRFPAAMPFIDTAMEGLRSKPVLPVMVTADDPMNRPAAKVLRLTPQTQKGAEAFREPAAVFERGPRVALPGW